MRRKRSTTCRFSLEPRKAVLSVKLVVSTTSVLPSQWPRESPISWWTWTADAGGRPWG